MTCEAFECLLFASCLSILVEVLEDFRVGLPDDLILIWWVAYFIELEDGCERLIVVELLERVEAGAQLVYFQKVVNDCHQLVLFVCYCCLAFDDGQYFVDEAGGYGHFSEVHEPQNLPQLCCRLAYCAAEYKLVDSQPVRKGVVAFIVAALEVNHHLLQILLHNEGFSKLSLVKSSFLRLFGC